MNKQEKEQLIYFINEAKEDLSFDFGKYHRTHYGYVLGTKVIAYIKQLDEPQKSKVPECVGKDLDGFTKARLKEDLVKDICLAVYDYSQGTPFDTSTVNWCRKGSNLRTMIDAIWNGYEVEQEPKWIVKDTRNSGMYFKGVAGISVDGQFSNSWSQREGCIKFSDKEKAEAVATLTGGTVEKV